jgi:hypothetical protein
VLVKHDVLGFRSKLVDDISIPRVADQISPPAHSMSEDRLAAQDEMLAAMMTPSDAVN